MAKEKQKLNPRWEKFCRLYSADPTNQIKAYKKAGFKPKNDNIARAAASRLLTNVNIQEKIAELKQKQFERMDIKADKILQEILNHAFGNISEVIKVSGRGTISLKKIDDLPENVQRLITSVSKIKGGFKITFCNKLEALKLLGQHLKLFTSIRKHEGKVGMEVTDAIAEMSDEEAYKKIARLEKYLNINQDKKKK